MKKAMIVAAIAMSFSAFADDAYQFVNVTTGSGQGYSYILINQNVDSFKIDISKYGEARAMDNRGGQWGEGHFKYYTYKGDVQKTTTTTGHGWNQHTTTTFTDSETGAAIQPVTIAKGTDSIDLGPLSAGTKIGFSFDDRGSDEWAYQFTESGRYQNGSSAYHTYEAGENEMLVNFNQTPYSSYNAVVGPGGHGGGYGGAGKSDWDDWMVISVSAKPSNVPNGAPLPGVLAVLLIGGLGAGSMKLRKRNRS